MSAYYNEIEPYAAQWLRNLIAKRLIADGEVDTRSIVDVQPLDLRGFTQCHFFAGIGGWGHALRLAGWPDDRPIWTGSCPCQPFSVAGKGAGTDDPRHLWPHFHRLIAACRPPVVMGEQVAGKAGYGWFDGVRTDLEATGYAGRAVDIPALAVNAPHIRQRLYWIAMDLANAGHMRRGNRPKSGEQELPPSSGLGSATVALVYPTGSGLERYRQSGRVAESGVRQTGVVVGGERCSPVHMADANGYGSLDDKQHSHGRSSKTVAECRGRISSDHMADTDQGGRGRRPHDGGSERDGQTRERHEDHGVVAGSGEDCGDVADAEQHGHRREASPAHHNRQEGDGPADQHSGHSSSSLFWSDAIWLAGSDGKSRRSKSGLPLLVNGVSGGISLVRARKDGTEETHIYNRVGALRAFGNAICAPLAAEVIKAFMETEA